MRITSVCLGIAILGLSGCTKSNSEEVTKLKAEVDALKVEVAKAKAENEVFKDVMKAEWAAIRTERSGRTGTPLDKTELDAKRAMMQTRLNSVNQITYETERQTAYQKLALDAAMVGQVEVAKECLGKITYETVRQDLYYKVALLFAKQGRGEDALELSKKINYETQKQKLLGKLAKGDFEE